MSQTPSRRLALLLALGASLTLAACGGGGGDSGTPVVTDPNGWNGVTALKTTDTVVGTGTAVDAGKVAPVAYTLWLYDVRAADTKGTKLESNVGQKPFSFITGSSTVIKGFDQGVIGMKPGGKRTITIPASLAYGASGNGSGVPANAALVFDVELDPLGWTAVTALNKQDLVIGSGVSADAGKTATVIYTAWLYDSHATDTKGIKIDSNVGAANGLKVVPGSNGAIAGFEQGVLGMRVGGKRTVTIPASLGYGNNGSASGTVPGGAVLVFDIELTAVTN